MANGEERKDENGWRRWSGEAGGKRKRRCDKKKTVGERPGRAGQGRERDKQRERKGKGGRQQREDAGQRDLAEESMWRQRCYGQLKSDTLTAAAVEPGAVRGP